MREKRTPAVMILVIGLYLLLGIALISCGTATDSTPPVTPASTASQTAVTAATPSGTPTPTPTSDLIPTLTSIPTATPTSEPTEAAPPREPKSALTPCWDALAGVEREAPFSKPISAADGGGYLVCYPEGTWYRQDEPGQLEDMSTAGTYVDPAALGGVLSSRAVSSKLSGLAVEVWAFESPDPEWTPDAGQIVRAIEYLEETMGAELKTPESILFGVVGPNFDWRGQGSLRGDTIEGWASFCCHCGEEGNPPRACLGMNIIWEPHLFDPITREQKGPPAVLTHELGWILCPLNHHIPGCAEIGGGRCQHRYGSPIFEPLCIALGGSEELCRYWAER